MKVSRQTVNQALTTLARRGLLTRRRGVGTFIAEPYIEQPLDGLYSFIRTLSSQGRLPSTKILGYRVTIDDQASTLLTGAHAGLVFEIGRLRLVDGEPFVVETIYLPVDCGETHSGGAPETRSVARRVDRRVWAGSRVTPRRRYGRSSLNQSTPRYCDCRPAIPRFWSNASATATTNRLSCDVASFAAIVIASACASPARNSDLHRAPDDHRDLPRAGLKWDRTASFAACADRLGATMARTVLILGAGPGGLHAAETLRSLLDDEDRIVIVDRKDEQYLGVSFLGVMAGWHTPDQITIHPSVLRERGVYFIQSEIESIDTDNHRVMVSGTTAPLGYDALVVALGAQLAPGQVDGLGAALESDRGGEFYTREGAHRLHRLLEEFAGGKVVVLVSRLPYKCPPAPYEGALLVDDLLRARGLRNSSAIDLFTPEPAPIAPGGPPVSDAVRSLMSQRDITLHTSATVTSIDCEARTIAFDGGEASSYDLLIAIPPHVPPSVVRQSKLGANGLDRDRPVHDADGRRRSLGGGGCEPATSGEWHANAEGRRLRNGRSRGRGAGHRRLIRLQRTHPELRRARPMLVCDLQRRGGLR